MIDLLEFLPFVQSRGLKVNTVYDIGAHIGDWSRVVSFEALPHAEFVLFEANPAYNDILKKTGFHWLNVCLSSPDRESVDFYNGTDTGDSYYKERTANYDHRTSVKVKTWTLDYIVRAYRFPPPDLIKLDTQGSELDILHGATNAIDHASLVVCECPIIEYNAGAPGIEQYLAFFREKRFVPIRITQQHALDGVLTQVDILFMKESAKEKYLGAHKVLRPFEDARLSNNPPIAVSA